MTSDSDFPTIRRPRRKSTRVRKLTRFELWAWSPVISFQIGLTASYLAMIYFGLSAAIASVPAFTKAAPDGWSLFWAGALVVGGVLGSIGSISRMKVFERLELVGAFLVSLTVGSYALLVLFLAYVLADAGRASGGAGFIALVVPVVVRTLWLASQTRRN